MLCSCSIDDYLQLLESFTTPETDTEKFTKEFLSELKVQADKVRTFDSSSQR